MLSTKDLDHHLLFKKLVILNEEESSADTKAEVKEQKQDKNLHTLEPSPEEKTTEIPQLLLPKDIIICADTIKETLKDPGSNLMKICRALNLENFHKHIFGYSEYIESDNSDVNYIWTIGLSEDEASQLSSTNSAKSIHSPNMEAPMSKEAKVEMYEPLKAYAADYHSAT